MHERRLIICAFSLTCALGALAAPGPHDDESDTTPTNHPPIATAIKFGYTRADIGGDGSDSLTRPEGASENQVALLLKWETRPAQPLKRSGNARAFGDVTVGGTLGFVPVMTVSKQVQKAAAGQPASEDKFRASFQQALTWDFMARANWHVGLGGKQLKATELSAVGRYGMNRLQELTTRTGEGDAVVNWAVVENDTGRWASFWEYGAELRVFHGDTPDPDTGELVRPLLTAALGNRHDSRFRRRGYFADAKFRDPADRHFLRVEWTDLALQVGKSTTTDTNEKPPTLSFAVDHEWSSHEETLPANTRFSITLGADLLKLMGISTQ